MGKKEQKNAPKTTGYIPLSSDISIDSLIIHMHVLLFVFDFHIEMLSFEEKKNQLIAIKTDVWYDGGMMLRTPGLEPLCNTD